MRLYPRPRLAGAGPGRIVDFAKAHGKRWDINEWGIRADNMNAGKVDMTGYMALVFDFLKKNGAHHAAWWENNSDYQSCLFDGAGRTKLASAYGKLAAAL